MCVLLLNATVSFSAVIISSDDGFDYSYEDAALVLEQYRGGKSEVTVPDSFYGAQVRAIGESAFAENSQLIAVILPDTVTQIRSLAFYDCGHLEDVYIPDSVTEIADDAFFKAPTSLRILGKKGSCAEAYALSHKYEFVEVGVYLLGDANGDDTVDAIDATVVQRYSLQIPVVFSYETLMHADVNGDGELDAVDATFIQRYALNIPTRYPIGESVSE